MFLFTQASKTASKTASTCKCAASAGACLHRPSRQKTPRQCLRLVVTTRGSFMRACLHMRAALMPAAAHLPAAPPAAAT